MKKRILKRTALTWLLKIGPKDRTAVARVNVRSWNVLAGSVGELQHLRNNTEPQHRFPDSVKCYTDCGECVGKHDTPEKSEP